MMLLMHLLSAKPTLPLPSSSDAPARNIWQGFVRGSLGTGAAIVARAMGALVLNKLLALYGGAGSLTQLAQFQNLMGLFGALPADGIQVGATTRLAPLLPGARRYRAWLGAAAGLTLGAVGLGGVVLGLTGGPGWGLLAVVGFTLGMAAVASQALLSTALLAAGQRRAYVWQAVALSVAGTAAAGGALLLHQPLPVVLGCYLGGQALVLLPTLVQARRASLLQGLRVGWPSRPAVRGLLRFVLMASGPLVFGRAVDYAVRAHLMAYYPPASTDLWQAVARLSDHYSLVVGAVLSTVFYPRLAALAVVPAQARHYLRMVLALLAAGVGGGLGVVFALRDWLLPLLFAPRLLAARELLAPQLLGDWAKFLVWVFLYQLLARARPLPYLAVQTASAVLYTALLVGLLPHLGLSGVVWAHAGRYGILLVACGFAHFLVRK
jgi:PST family polysaccharide transporter